MRQIRTILLGVLGFAAGCATIYLGGILMMLLFIWLSEYIQVHRIFLMELTLPILLAGGLTALFVRKARQALTSDAKHQYQIFTATFAVGTVLTIMFWIYLQYYVLPTVTGP